MHSAPDPQMRSPALGVHGAWHFADRAFSGSTAHPYDVVSITAMLRADNDFALLLNQSVASTHHFLSVPAR